MGLSIDDNAARPKRRDLTLVLAAVSYGTEAGLFQAAGIASVVCGPGDIARAHKPEEYLTRDELQATCALIRRLGESLSR